MSERRFFEPNPTALASWEGVDLDTASSSMSIVASRGIGSLHSLGRVDTSKTVFSLIGILAAPISLQEVCLYPKVKDSHVNKEIGVIPQAGCDLICDPVGTADVKERADPRRTTLRH